MTISPMGLPAATPSTADGLQTTDQAPAQLPGTDAPQAAVTRTPRHGGHHHRPTQGSEPVQGVDQLSSSLGVTSQDLMTRLSDGTGIDDLLTAHPQVAATLTGQQNKGALLDGYA